MRSMQELFFGWAGWDGTLRLPNVFVTEKEHNFQTDENIELLHLKRKKKKTDLSELTQIFCSPLSKYF